MRKHTFITAINPRTFQWERGRITGKWKEYGEKGLWIYFHTNDNPVQVSHQFCDTESIGDQSE